MIREANEPLYHTQRSFLGLNDLVISYYTQVCSHLKCTHCNLHADSANGEMPAEKIKAQTDWVFSKYNGSLPLVERVSIGNRGSILDPNTFPQEALLHVLERTGQSINPHVFSLETRAEYITKDQLRLLRDNFEGDSIYVTVGFETRNDDIRNGVLRKALPIDVFERKVSLLGEFGISLTPYVMLKPGPTMTEQQGVEDVKNTMKYLADLRDTKGVDIVIYLSPTYVAKGTELAKEMVKENYEPPKESSVLEVVRFSDSLGIKTFVRLDDEEVSSDSEAEAKRKIISHNNTGESSSLSD